MKQNARSLVWIISLVVIAAAIAVLFLFDPANASIYPDCLFRRVTGLDCPGCGGLRATHQLLQGNIPAAFQLNPLFILFIPVLAAIALRALWRRQRKIPSDAVRPLWLWIFCAMWIGFGVLRNLDHSPLSSSHRVNAPLAESTPFP